MSHRLRVLLVASLCLAGCRGRVDTPETAGGATVPQSKGARRIAQVEPAPRPTSRGVKDGEVAPVTPPVDSGRKADESTAKQPESAPPPPKPPADDPAIKGLIEQLKDKTPKVRVKAAEELANKGRDAQAAVPTLIALLKEPDPSQTVHPALYRAIERLGLDESLLPSLLADLKAKDWAVAERADRLLAMMGGPAVDSVLAAMKDTDALVRRHAIRAVFHMREPPDKVIPALMERLRDPVAENRMETGSSLGRLGPRAAPAVGALVQEVQAKNVMAAWALGRIGPLAKEGIPALRVALADPVTATPVVRFDPSDAGKRVPGQLSLAEASAEALGLIGADAAPAAPELIRALRDARPFVRRNAATALGHVQPENVKATASALAAILSDADPAVRTAAAGALGELGNEASAAGPALVRALREKNQTEGVVAAAGGALGRLRLDKDAAAALVKALKAAGPIARRHAAKALGQTRPVPPSAVSALVEALSDAQAGVRAAAAEGLGNIGSDARPALAPLAKCATGDASEEVQKAAAEAMTRINK